MSNEEIPLDVRWVKLLDYAEDGCKPIVPEDRIKFAQIFERAHQFFLSQTGKREQKVAMTVIPFMRRNAYNYDFTAEFSEDEKKAFLTLREEEDIRSWVSPYEFVPEMRAIFKERLIK